MYTKCRERIRTKNFIETLHIKVSKRNLSEMFFLLTLNQSIVQQLISEGNMRRRFLNASPIGLKAKTT